MIRSKDIVIVPIKEIRENPKNRNKHNKEQIDRLVDIIKFQGFRNPLIISNQTGFLNSGHGRLLAAKKLGLKELPVSYQDFESDDQEYASMVSDNAIASWSELDLPQINIDLESLGPFNIELLGIKDFKIDVSEFGSGNAEDQQELNKLQILECPHCGESFERDQAKIIG